MKLNKLKLFILVFIIFLGIGLTIYSNSFNNEFFWDDDDSIVNNEYIKDFKYLPNYFSENLIAGTGQTTNYWRPVLLISFAVDYHIYGLNPTGFHATNTILHIIVAFLIFVLIFELSKENKIVSFLTALIFLVHPLQTEAITYVAGRADPLSSIFLLLTLIFYINFRKESLKKHKKTFFILSFFSFFLGLLTKEQIILTPLLIALIEGLFFFKKENWEKSLKILIPFFSLSIIYFISRITLLNFNNILSGMDYMADYNSSLWIRLLTFTWVFNKYIFLMFTPLDLHMAYEVNPITSIFSFSVLLFIFFILILFFFIFKNIKKEKIISFSLLWFFIILLPRTNILKINRPLYEHWLYLPLAGFFLFIIYLIYIFINRIKKGKVKKIIKLFFILLFILFSIFLSYLTIQRNKDWKDPITFYEKNLKYTPNSFIQRNNLGMAYADEGMYEKAIEQYNRAIAISDYYPQVHYNLANSLLATGNLIEAKKEYYKAIKISPSFIQPYSRLFNIYIKENKKEEAFSLLDKFKENIPFEYYFKYSLPVFINFNEYNLAISICEEILEKYPENIEVRSLLLNLKINAYFNNK